MKKVLILGRQDDRTDYDTSQSFVRALGEVNSEIKYSGSYLEDITFVYDETKIIAYDTVKNYDLKEFDAVFLIGWFKTRKLEELALSVSKYMLAAGKKVLNSEAINNRSRSKLSQLVTAALNGVPTAQYITINSVEQLKVCWEHWPMEFPLIAKSASASRGRDNHLVQSFEELERVVRELPTKIMVIQRFVENDGDLRVIVMGEEVRLVIGRRAQEGTHLNNTSHGGTATIMDTKELDQSMLDHCVKISKLLGREITGVDMIQDKHTGMYYLLEINNMPQLSTGSFVAEKSQQLDAFFSQWLAE